MEQKKETKTYRFDKEVIKHSDNNPFISSFSEWVCERYRDEFMQVETLAEKMDNYLKLAEDCKEKIKVLKELNKNTFLNNLEKDWIKTEGLSRVYKNFSLEGIYKYFCNKFNRNDINRRQFYLFLQQAKNKEL